MLKRIKLGIKGKMTAVFVAMGVLLSLSIGYAVYATNYRQVTSQYSEVALATAQAAAALVNGDSIDAYLTYGADKEYEDTYVALQKLKTFFGLTYLYAFKPHEGADGGIYEVIFDIYSEGDDEALILGLGDMSDGDELFGVILETFRTGRVGDGTIVSNSEYGWLASAYVPVYASGGEIAAVVGVDISMDRIMGDIARQTFQLVLIAVAVVVLFLCVLRLIAGRQILRPIVRLSRHMEGFDSGEGNLKEIEVFDSGDELQAMAESFNRMVGDIRLYMLNLATVTADRERIATELDVATKIQASMLPSIFPAFPERPEFDIYASMQPAKEVGGDFYDMFLLDESTIAVVMADVSGKGVPAALFMVIAKTLIKNNAQSGLSPKEVFEAVNNILCENNDAGMFVTAILGYLDIPTGKFAFVNAGHNPPLLRCGRGGASDGNFDWLKTTPDFILAGMEDMLYVQHEVVLQPGDELFLYTDGVTEAVNNEKALFSDPRLLETANRYLGLSPKEFAVSIKREIDKFAEGAEQADDITMLVLRYIHGKEHHGFSGIQARGEQKHFDIKKKNARL